MRHVAQRLKFIDEYYTSVKSVARSSDRLEDRLTLAVLRRIDALEILSLVYADRAQNAQEQALLRSYGVRLEDSMCLSIFMLSRESADSEFPSRVAQLLYQLSLLEESSGQQVFPNQESRLNLLMGPIKRVFKILNLILDKFGQFNPDHNQHLFFEGLIDLFIEGLTCINDDCDSLELKNQYRDLMLDFIKLPGGFDYIFLAFPKCGETMISLLIQSQDRDLLSAFLMKLECCLGQTFTLNQLNSDEKILILPEDCSLEISELSVSKASWSLKSILRYLLKHGDQDQLVSQFFYSTIKNVRACSFPLSHFIFSPAVGGIEIFSNAERLKIASLSPETRQLAHAFCKSCIVQDGTSIDITMLIQILLGLQQKTRLANIRSSVRDAQDYKAARAVCPSVVVTGHLSQSEKGQLESEYQAAIEFLKQEMFPAMLLSQIIGSYIHRVFKRSAGLSIIKENLYWSSQFGEDVDSEAWLSFPEDRFEAWSRAGFPKHNQDAFDSVCRPWFEMFSKIFDLKGREDLDDICESLKLIVAGHEGQTVRFLRDCIDRFLENIVEMQRDEACSPPFDRLGSPVPAVEVAAPAVEVAAPAVEVATPAVKFAAPAVEVAAPAVKFAAPAAAASPPMAKNPREDAKAAQAARLAQLNLNQ